MNTARVDRFCMEMLVRMLLLMLLIWLWVLKLMPQELHNVMCALCCAVSVPVVGAVVGVAMCSAVAKATKKKKQQHQNQMENLQKIFHQIQMVGSLNRKSILISLFSSVSITLTNCNTFEMCQCHLKVIGREYRRPTNQSRKHDRLTSFT